MKAYLEAQGSLLVLKAEVEQSFPRRGGGGRHKITVFSKASRRRLLRFMARLRVKKIRATFITLTFSGEPSHEEAKRALKQWLMRIRRAFQDASAVWRMEYQPQRGVIHFHLLFFNLPFWKQSEVQKSWEGCTGEERSIVDIRLVHGARSVMAYVSKYIAKHHDQTDTSLDDVTYQHSTGEIFSGRWWGYHNKDALPLAERLEGVLLDRCFINDLSKWAWRLTGADNTYKSTSFHLFTNNAAWFWHMFIERGGLDIDEYKNSQIFNRDERWAIHVKGVALSV